MQHLILDQQTACLFFGKRSFFNDSLVEWLTSSHSFRIDEHTDKSRRLLETMQRAHPDGVMIDIDEPETDIPSLIASIRQRQPLSRIIVLSDHASAYQVEQAKKWGASGYVLKSYTKEQLLQSMHLILSGINFFPHLNNTPLELHQAWDAICKTYQITPREKEILQLLKNGLTNKEIAATLFLSVLTVETHRKHIMQKMQLNSTTALIKFFIENGL